MSRDNIKKTYIFYPNIDIWIVNQIDVTHKPLLVVIIDSTEQTKPHKGDF